MAKAGGVPINPSQFAADGGILDMFMEEVVSMFLDKEKRRHKDARDDENQQEDTMGYRVVPAGLLMALDANARYLGITRALLTRCLSHQVAAWLDSLSRIKNLVELFDVAHDAAAEYGYPDLYDGMRPNYIFLNPSNRAVSLRTIRWVRNKLTTISQPVGVSTSIIFVVGLCYALSRSSDGRTKGTVNKYLAVEVVRFTQHIEEQFIRVCAFHDLVRRRAVADGFDNTITR